MPQRGWETVTIPGAVSGWVALSKRYGKLPFGDLFEPAIRYARDGYAVSPVVADKWRACGAADAAGTRLAGSLPDRAARACARRALPVGGHGEHAVDDRRDVRRSVLSRRACRSDGRACAGDGSVHARADFERHTVDWVTPIAVDYRGIRVHEIPPNGQGIAALMALGMLESFDLAALPPDSVASQHLQIEAMKLAFADAYRYVARPVAR